jgi:hypothetical protein
MTSSDAPLKRSYHTKGFGLGTAILTASQLKEVHTLITQAFGRLNDPTIEVLRQALEERLEMAKIEVDSLVPIRAFANRSIIDASASALPAKALAHQAQLNEVEEAILHRRAIQIKVPGNAHVAGKSEITVWPLQILFHNIGWYLAYELMALPNLLTVARLDRIQLISARLRQQRSLKEMRVSQRRLDNLCRRTGGIFLGDNHIQQRALAEEYLSDHKIKKLLQDGTLAVVRFHCSSRIYSFIRSGSRRYPPEQMRLSGPLPTDDWTVDVEGVQLLTPDPDNSAHPYPVELLLPAWTVDSYDFTSWLFGFGGELRIEAPVALRDKHRAFGQGIAALYEGAEQAAQDSQGNASP